MYFWDFWWIIPLIMIAMCIFMMFFMMRGCMRKMRHMMTGSTQAGTDEAGMEMAHCPCMAMMGRFMKGPAAAKEQSKEKT
jgi:hypothetical protein